MQKNYRYTLEKGSKKHICPDCNKKTFVRFIDTQTGQYLPLQYGKCDRENKCDYFLNPYKDGFVKSIWQQEKNIEPQFKKVHFKKSVEPIVKPVYFNYEAFKQTLNPDLYEENTFLQNLLYKVPYPFKVDEVLKVISLYKLGTVINKDGPYCCFPFIDYKGNVRTVQAKQFNEENKTINTNWLHSILSFQNRIIPSWLQDYNKQDKKVSCLFGEHLLSKYPNKKIALVEAPKTAIYGSLYFGFPDNPENFIWLAVYNKSSFSFDKLKVLKGRYVYVFPDLSKEGNTFKEWETKAKAHEKRLPKTKFILSNFLERFANKEDKLEGMDLADYLIKYNWKQFIKESPKSEASEESEVKKTIFISSVKPIQINNEKEKIRKIGNHKKKETIDWGNEIEELENYFKNIPITKEPLQLNKGCKILDLSYFIDSHLRVLKAYNGKKTFTPFLNRLQDLKQVLSI